MNAVTKRLIAAGLAGAWVWACSPPKPTDGPLRLVDPSLRIGSSETPTRALVPTDENAAIDPNSTAQFPRATIDSDTRPVLQMYPRVSLASARPTACSSDGRGSAVFDLGDQLPSAQHVLLTVLARLPTGTTQISTSWAPIVRRDGKREVDLAFLVSPPTPQVMLTVMAQQVPLGGRTFYRSPELRIPPGASLDFSFGILEEARDQGPVRFSIETCESSECSMVFEEILDPTDDPVPSWHARQISLANLAGHTRALAFETELIHRNGDRFSMPVWANPTLRPEPTASEPERHNLILLSIDTLRRDHLGSYGYHRDTSPFLDGQLAPQGTVFDNLTAEAASTGPSHMTMFTSLPTLVHRVHGLRSPEVRLTTVAEVLRAAGFETAAFTENGPLAHHRGFELGFDRYHENKNRGNPNPIWSPNGEADETFRRGREWMLEWIQQRHGSPFFLFLHTFQVHAPYQPPEAYRDLFPNTQSRSLAELAEGSPGWNKRERSVVDYDREIRYVDDKLEELVHWLAKTGLVENTILVVVSDHGEEFFEHGRRGHTNLPYETLLRVPLIFYGPGIPWGRRIREAVHHLDLMPTILDLLGVPASTPLWGRSFASLLREEAPRPEGQGRPIFSTAWALPKGLQPPALAVRVGSRKLIRFTDADGLQQRYFDLDRDPMELTDLHEEFGEDVAELAALLDRYVEDSARLRETLLNGAGPDNGGLRLELDPEREAKLRALGYLGD
ncbi:MAG: sulfatase [Myxococcota bacterium]